jgi:general secretion pathway protein A
VNSLYGAWFGLQREPFSIAPDPRTLFMSERHREALAHLLYGVQGGGGFVLLTGEIGAGKTTVSRCFLEQVPEGCRVAYVFNPKQTVDELLWTIAQEFGVQIPGQVPGQVPSAGAGDRIEGGSKALVDALNRFLLQVHATWRRASASCCRSFSSASRSCAPWWQARGWSSWLSA